MSGNREDLVRWLEPRSDVRFRLLLSLSRLLPFPPDISGLGLVTARLTEISQASAHINTAQTKLAALAIDDAVAEGVVSRDVVQRINPRHGVLQYAPAASAHPHAGRFLSTFPVWTVMVIDPVDRWAWSILAGAVVASQIRLSRATNTQLPRPPYHSAVENACRALRRLAVESTIALPSRLQAPNTKYRIDGVGRLLRHSADEHLQTIASLCRLAAGDRLYGPGGTSTSRAPSSAEPKPQQKQKRPEQTGTRSPVAAYTYHPRADDDDDAPDERIATTILFDRVDCSAPEPLATRAARAQSQRSALERSGIHYRYDVAEYLPADLERFASLLAAPPSPESDRFRAWLAGALLLITGRPVDDVLEFSVADEPTGRAMQYIPTEGRLIARVPAPRYRTTLSAHDLRGTRLVEAHTDIAHDRVLAFTLRAWHRVYPFQSQPFVADEEARKRLLAQVESLYGIGVRPASSLAGPLRLAVRDVCGDGATVGMVTGFMPHDGSTQAYYLCLSGKTLRNIHEQALIHAFGSSFSERIVPSSAELSWHGARRCPTDEALIELFTGLRKSLQGADDDWISYANRYTAYSVLVTCLGLAQRGVIDPAPSELASSGRLIRIEDKAGVAGYHMRFAPCPSAVMQQMRHYGSFRQNLPAIDAEPESFFLICDPGGRRRAFGPSDLNVIWPDFQQPLHSLRRWMRTRLFESGASPAQIDAYLGHWSAGREPWAPWSALSIDRLRSELLPHIDRLLNSVSARPIPSIRPPP